MLRHTENNLLLMGIAIEAKGTNCEIIKNKDKTSYTGSCPGYYIYEFKKSINLV
jgi:hypothetical protein